jgi:hypothetical protein
MFVIDNSLYGGSFYSGKLSSFNLDTKMWTSKAGLLKNEVATYYYPEASVVRGKAYVIAGTELFSYDPIANGWTAHGYIGGSGSRTACFSIGDKVFLGLGEMSGYEPPYKETELFSYDVVTGAIEQYRNCPIRMSVSASITVSNKAYIFSFDVVYDNDDYVYEFDPSKN